MSDSEETDSYSPQNTAIAQLNTKSSSWDDPLYQSGEDEDGWKAIERRLLPPADTPEDEIYELYLEDVEISRVTKPFNYIISWFGIQLQLFSKKRSKWVKFIFLSLFVVVYLSWLIAGCILEFEKTLELLIVTIIILLFVLWELFVVRNWEMLTKPLQGCGNFMQTNFWFGLGFGLVAFVLFLTFLIWDGYKDPYRFVALGGWLAMTYCMILFSRYPHRIHWRPILWGYGLGFIFALFVLRTQAGISTITYLSNQIAVFLGYADDGALFVFGEFFEEVWAFRILPVVVYFAAVVSVLFYSGALLYLIKKLCWLMEQTLDTSGSESLVAAGNIFVGISESPLLIGPFAKVLTRSELLACMTSSFASIAGSVFGAFLVMDIDAGQLLTAVVTSAPIALACAKLAHPEIQKSATKSAKDLKPEKTDYSNVLDAFAGGAYQAIPLCAGIAAQLIAFVSIISFFDGIAVWLGLMIRMDDPHLTIDLVLSYVFYPFAICCGVELEDCLLAGKYMGIRLFINEFIAYGELAEDTLRRDEECCNKFRANGEVIWLNQRSETICIYALCGFANLGSIGVMIAGFYGVCPTRKTAVSQLVVLALFAGNFACLIRGSIAAILYNENWDDPCSVRIPC